MVRKHIVLLIAIRKSDGDVESGGPLRAYRQEYAMCRHRVSPSPFTSSSSSHIQHTLQNNYIYNHPNLTIFSTQIQIHITQCNMDLPRRA